MNELDNLLKKIQDFQKNPAIEVMTPKAILIHVETMVYEEKINLLNQQLNK